MLYILNSKNTSMLFWEIRHLFVLSYQRSCFAICNNESCVYLALIHSPSSIYILLAHYHFPVALSWSSPLKLGRYESKSIFYLHMFLTCLPGIASSTFLSPSCSSLIYVHVNHESWTFASSGGHCSRIVQDPWGREKMPDDSLICLWALRPLLQIPAAAVDGNTQVWGVQGE